LGANYPVPGGDLAALRAKAQARGERYRCIPKIEPNRRHFVKNYGPVA
jgi:hypothetical protein